MSINKYTKFLKNKEVSEICEKYNIERWTLNENGTIDVDDDVLLTRQKMYELPIRFNIVRGKFVCSNNKLSSLYGSPTFVGGDFSCHSNVLVNLIHSPKEVKGSFNCDSNELVSLEGSPKIVGGLFSWSHNKLGSLIGSPDRVGSFTCNWNKLKSLEGSPSTIDGDFNCQINKISILNKSTIKIGGWYFFGGNPIENITKLFIELDRNKYNSAIDLLDNYNVIQIGAAGESDFVVTKLALEEIFEELDLPIPNITDINGYDLV